MKIQDPPFALSLNRQRDYIDGCWDFVVIFVIVMDMVMVTLVHRKLTEHWL